MKLAEALQERADLNRNIQQLESRLSNNVLVQEGEKTPESPEDLKRELDSAAERLAYLITHINMTNNSASADGKTLTQIIAEKDVLTLKIGVYKNIVQSASMNCYRARGTEIKILPTISVADWQKQIDAMEKKLRLLDNKLQQSNWNTDLIE